MTYHPTYKSANGAAPQIPEEETTSLLLTYSDAVDRAERHQVSLGHALLIRGLHRAELALVDGEPWGPELVRSWRELIDRYCAQFGDEEEG